MSRLDDIAARLEAPIPYPESLLLEQPRADIAALLEFARAVEALHVPKRHDAYWRQYCAACERRYPCPTAEALKRLEDR